MSNRTAICVPIGAEVFFYIITYFFNIVKLDPQRKSGEVMNEANSIASRSICLIVRKSSLSFVEDRSALREKRLHMIVPIGAARFSGENIAIRKVARSLRNFAYGCRDRKIGPCLPSAARSPLLLYHMGARLSRGKTKKNWRGFTLSQS